MFRLAILLAALAFGGPATAQTTPSREEVSRVGACVQAAAARG